MRSRHKQTLLPVQAYNAQLGVEAEAQLIVAAEVTQDVTDHHQLVRLVKQVRGMTAKSPVCITAGAGYWHTARLLDARFARIHMLVSPDSKRKKSCQLGSELAKVMHQNLPQAPNRVLYDKRQMTVEPVIAQIKEGRGFLRFRFRDRSRVQAEWQLICSTHNLLKLFRLKWRPAPQ